MGLTAWHITFGTYATRLHGDPRLTVDRDHNQRHGPFVEPSPARQSIATAILSHAPVRLTRPQRVFVEHTIPSVCIRGGWRYDTCACPSDHAHTLLRADDRIHGKRIRHWLKWWLSESLNKEFGLQPGDGAWWAEGGSTKVVHDDDYLRTVTAYIDAQRTTRRHSENERTSGPTGPGSLGRDRS